MKYKPIMKRFFFVILLLLFLFVSSSCLNADTVKEIKEGFSEVLLQDLKEDYGITVPENAIFLVGETTGWQDNYVNLLFLCPVNQNVIWDSPEMQEMSDEEKLEQAVRQTLSLNEHWFDVGGNSPDKAQFIEQYGGRMPYHFSCDMGFSSLNFRYLQKENLFLIRFIGFRADHRYP